MAARRGVGWRGKARQLTQMDDVTKRDMDCRTRHEAKLKGEKCGGGRVEREIYEGKG